MKCKECKNTLKQLGETTQYFCESSPNVCSQSLKKINK